MTAVVSSPALEADPTPERHADFALASACVAGEVAARREVARLIQREVPAAIARAHPSGALTDDVVQRVVELVVVGDAQRAPKIQTYAGRGPLGAWIRVIALREARRLARARTDAADVSVEQLGGAIGSDLAEDLAPFKATMRATFKTCFEAALGSLSAWDRELLRGYVLGGRSIDALAKKHEVHRATVARWLGKIRASLHTETQRRMQVELSLTPGAFESVMSLIGSRLEASFSRVLGPPPRR